MSRGDSLPRVVAHVRRRRLVAEGDRVLLGLGGGVASAGMLAAFIMGREAGLARCELAVAAVETDPSEEHDGAEVVAEVGRVARSFGLPFFAVRPAMHRGAVRVAVELKALARDQGFNRVALAHTRDDEVRRVLRGLSADQGLDGVRGISSRAAGGVIHPVLPLRDAEAAALARDLGIEPVQLPPDATAGAELERVILTRWRAREPGLDRSLLRIAQEVRALRRMVSAQAGRWVSDARVGEGRYAFRLRRGETVAGPLAMAVGEALLGAVSGGAAVSPAWVRRLAKLFRDPAAGRGRGASAPTLVLPGLQAEVRLTEEGVVVLVATSVRRGPSRASG
ncbi:MAG: hypothetical protein U0325_22050 [Polyangiales bacterium]